MKRIFIAMLAMLLPIMAHAQKQTVTSPNGNIVLNFSIEAGRPTYEMSYKGKAVVKPSHLGLILAADKHASAGTDETDLMSGFTLADAKTSSFDETWEPVWGETKSISLQRVGCDIGPTHRIQQGDSN